MIGESCDRCKKFCKYNPLFYDYKDKAIGLCSNCIKEWSTLYFKVYPHGADIWKWTKLFTKFLDMSKEKVLFT